MSGARCQVSYPILAQLTIVIHFLGMDNCKSSRRAHSPLIRLTTEWANDSMNQ